MWPFALIFVLACLEGASDATNVMTALKAPRPGAVGAADTDGSTVLQASLVAGIRELVESVGVYPEDVETCHGTRKCDGNKDVFCHDAAFLGCQPCAGYCGQAHEDTPSVSCLQRCPIFLFKEKLLHDLSGHIEGILANRTSGTEASGGGPPEQSAPCDREEAWIIILVCVVFVLVMGILLAVIFYLRKSRTQCRCGPKESVISEKDVCGNRDVEMSLLNSSKPHNANSSEPHTQAQKQHSSESHTQANSARQADRAARPKSSRRPDHNNVSAPPHSEHWHDQAATPSNHTMESAYISQELHLESEGDSNS